MPSSVPLSSEIAGLPEGHDLCVKPEFQELFRTTTNRLVTEARKDFCANTAFRWDIYGRGLEPMATAADRLRDADDIHYRVARRGITLPYKSNLGVVTSTVQGPLYKVLLGLLGDRCLRLSELIAAKELEGTSPEDVIKAVDAGVAMGMFDITATGVPADPGPLSGKLRLASDFNRAVLGLDSLGGRPVALASRLTGTGHSLGDFDAAILHELLERGRDGLVERVETRLAGSGRSLQQNGEQVTDPAARKQLVQQACTAFLGTALPQLASLRIVIAA